MAVKQVNSGHVTSGTPIATSSHRIPFVRGTGVLTQDLNRLAINKAPGLISPRPRPPGNPTAELL